MRRAFRRLGSLLLAARLPQVVAGLAVLGACGWGVSVGIDRLQRRVEGRLLERFGDAELELLGVPDVLGETVRRDLTASVSDLLERRWTDPRLCRAIAERLAGSGWVRRVHFVRRTPDARFQVEASYRTPAAIVSYEGRFFFVDREGVRLPGVYPFDPRWTLIEGVASAPPAAGERWPGDDLRAGVAIAVRLEREPFREQIPAVLVDNVGGRRDRRRSHVVLATDRAGGRILWGSAPGAEVEENSVEQKLAILRSNFRATGRVDGGHAVIDVSVFPDRFVVVE